MKTCIKCHRLLGEYSFYKAKTSLDDLQSSCKECFIKDISIRQRKNRIEVNLKNNNWKKRNPIRTRANRLRNRFGISLEQYNEMLAKQNGVCAICKQKETCLDRTNTKVKYLSVDHCHRTNKIRGLLCQKCNGTLGMVNEDIQILNNLIKYIGEHNG